MIEILLAFLAGLLIGSFLNVCIYRLPRDLTVWSPARSFCPGCEKTIAWYDNIPLVSFALLKGRSRCCDDEIPWRYPIVELVTGLTFALSVWMFGVTVLALKYVVFSATVIDLVATDFEVRILPDEFTKGGILLGLIFAWFVPLDPELSGVFLLLLNEPLGSLNSLNYLSVLDSALAAGLVSGLVWFVAWAYMKVRHREGMGMGDFKMMAMIGAFWGLRLSLFSFFLSAIAGSVLGPVYALIAKRKLIARLRRMGWKNPACSVVFRYQLPFGSFLGLMAWITAFWLR